MNELTELLQTTSINSVPQTRQDNRENMIQRHSATHQGIDNLITLVQELKSELNDVRNMQSSALDQHSMTHSTLENMTETLDYHVNISDYTSAKIEHLTNITKNGLTSLMENGLSVRRNCLPPKTKSDYLGCLKDLMIILISVYYFVGYVYFQICSTIMKITHTTITKIPFISFMIAPLIELALLLILFWIGTILGQVGTLNFVHRQTIGAFAIEVIRILCFKASYLLKNCIIYISDDLIGMYKSSGLEGDVQCVQEFTSTHMPRIELLDQLHSLSKYTVLPNGTHIYQSSGLASALNSSSVLFNHAGEVVSKTTQPFLSKAGEHIDIAGKILKENGKDVLTSASSVVGNGISQAMSFLSSQAENIKLSTGGSKSSSPSSKRRTSKSLLSSSKRRTIKKKSQSEWNHINQHLSTISIQDSSTVLIVLLSTLLDLSKMYSKLSDEGRQIMNDLIMKKYKSLFDLKEIYGFKCLTPHQGSLKENFFEVYKKDISFLM
jgi:hypothetical protein